MKWPITDSSLNHSSCKNCYQIEPYWLYIKYKIISEQQFGFGEKVLNQAAIKETFNKYTVSTR